MRRVLNLSLVVTASVLFIWLLPFTSTFVSGVEEASGGLADRRSLGGRILSWVATVLTWWERWSREKFYQRVDRFLVEHCDPVWGVLFKMGFYRLGSQNPQTVLAHRLAVESRFVREARIEEFSDEEIARGIYMIRLHEIDEVATRRDQERLKLPHIKARREAFVEEWWPEDDWIPSAAGDVSVRWRRDYEESRPLAYEYLRKKYGKRFADRAIIYYDDFHVGMDRVSILARDNHYAETVEEGIVEQVPVRHFALEARFAIANPRIRARVDREYSEGVIREEQEPIDFSAKQPKRGGGGN